jgi:hypothetical protein
MRQEGRVDLEQTIPAEKTRYPRSRLIPDRGQVNKLNDRHGIDKMAAHATEHLQAHVDSIASMTYINTMHQRVDSATHFPRPCILRSGAYQTVG